MSNVLAKALNVTKTYESLLKIAKSKNDPYPDSYEKCVNYLHQVELETNNFIQHKMIENVWIALFYKTWLYYKKTYVVDTDFFMSLTKIRSVRIYPSVLKTLPFNTFSVDLSGYKTFNGHILCSFDVTEKGIYCSFLSSSNDSQENTVDDKIFNNDFKAFGVFLDIKDMKLDENNEYYFDLCEDSEECSDISFYRKPSFLAGINSAFKELLNHKNEINNVLGPKFLDESMSEELLNMEMSYLANRNDINSDDKWLLLKKALIQFAYYLCTPETDIYESKDTKHKFSRAKRLKKDTKDFEYKYIVGSRIGARIRLGSSVSNDIGESIEGKKGSQKCPHVRAAHWTHVWCGPKGAQHIEPRFIEVTFVNYSLGNIDEICNEVTDKVKQNWDGENLICRALEARNINYKRQSTVVIQNHRYRFDVETIINDKKCYIEYDGEQHFYPVSIFGGEESFKRTREADLLKNQYCYDNNIFLLRIPYHKKGNIDELIDSFINDPENITFTKYIEESYYT